MALYLARIELKPSSGKSYADLHFYMENVEGFSRDILSTINLQSRLPTGTYCCVAQDGLSTNDLVSTLHKNLTSHGFDAILIVGRCDIASFILD